MRIPILITRLREFLRRPEQLAVWASLLLSLVALAVSARSCAYAGQATEIARDDYESKRLLVLRLVETQGDEFAFQPIDNSFQVYGVLITLPEDLIKNAQISKPSTFAKTLELSIHTLREYVQRNVPYNAAQMKLDFIKLPIALETEYVVHGNRFTDRSLYNLDFHYTMNGAVKPGGTHITIDGISFLRRLAVDENASQQLTNALQSISWKPRYTVALD